MFDEDDNDCMISARVYLLSGECWILIVYTERQQVARLVVWGFAWNVLGFVSSLHMHTPDEPVSTNVHHARMEVANIGDEDLNVCQ